MKPEMLKKFDDVMARLKPIEPSASFDSRFQERLKKASRERQVFVSLALTEPSPAFDAVFFEKLRAARLEKARESYAGTLLRDIARRVDYIVSSMRTPALAYVTALAFFIVGGVYLFTQTRPVYLTVASAQGISRCGEGSVIETGTGAKIDIVLKGKYAIRIKENTRLEIAKLTPRSGSGVARFVLKQGSALVSIEEGFKPSRFVIDTGAAEAVALGTKFSVDVSKKRDTGIKVLEGKVEVKNQGSPAAGQETILVAQGQKTHVMPGLSPERPKRLSETEWLQLDELYSLGTRAKVMLMIKNTPDRVLQLLRPCALYVSDTKPREIPKLIDKALMIMGEAIQTNDKVKHREAIALLEGLVAQYPDKKYNAALRLYIGAYYRYLGSYEDAIRTFKEVIAAYPDSTLESLAECAIGVVYEQDLHDTAK
ncbi:MAG: FecR domain-containing protein, partial [Candidatus Omnitrophica bacterium]|nr:FecR domain-containing protein [Candidatus Omnitrophota bacterium]